MRTVVGMMLASGLLALAGCGGGTRVVTKIVTAGPPSSTPKTTVSATRAPGPDAIAAAQTLVGSTLAGNAEQAALPGGDAVFAAAVGAAADTLAIQPGGSSPAHTRSSTSGGGTVSPTRVVSGQASGEYAVAYTDGTFQHPSGISLHVNATPAQNGSVDWNVVCFEDSGGIGRLEGRATIGLPTTKSLPLPAPSHTCIVSANVQLAKTGTVTISITA